MEADHTWFLDASELLCHVGRAHQRNHGTYDTRIPLVLAQKL